jgi:hypothetical protein
MSAGNLTVPPGPGDAAALAARWGECPDLARAPNAR